MEVSCSFLRAIHIIIAIKLILQIRRQAKIWMNINGQYNAITNDTAKTMAWTLKIASSLVRIIWNEIRPIENELLSFCPAVQIFQLLLLLLVVYLNVWSLGAIRMCWPRAKLWSLWPPHIMNIQIEQKYLMMVLGFKVKIN